VERRNDTGKCRIQRVSMVSGKRRAEGWKNEFERQDSTSLRSKDSRDSASPPTVSVGLLGRGDERRDRPERKG
jgi:hypothetical protein